MPKRKLSMTGNLNAEAFLRSINLCFDADEPERIAHYRPTTKSVPLVHGLLGHTKERSFLVVAPYGSGKSLTLTYLLQVIENRPNAQTVLSAIEKRIEAVSPGLRKMLLARRRSRKRGIVLALHGFQGNLAQALRDAAMAAVTRNKLGRQSRSLQNMQVSTIEDAVAFLHQLKETCGKAGLDQICILWDESGRHLETLLSDGRAAELSDIQVIAEYASRSRDLPITLGLTLHQSMLHYAQQMTQAVRAEWQKISGRFEAIQYVDDSKETYRLLAEIIESNRGSVNLPTKNVLRLLARTAKKKHGLFADFTLDDLASLFKRTFPADPAAVYLLPRVSARVAQNERTLFTFLYATMLGDGFGVSDLYDYFAPSMRGDTAIGGTHKQWLETESAITKTGGDERCINVLKTACLLGMGTKGERSRVEKSTLIWSVQGYGGSTPWNVAVSQLITEKLLLYRTHSQEVAVWHGTDVDLRGRLADEKARHRAVFDVLAFLNKEARPEAWKPIEYNTVHGVNRYWSGVYITADDFAGLGNGNQLTGVDIGCDGKIIHLVAETGEELCDAREAAENHIHNPQIVTAIPSTPLNLREAALEVWCLSNMQHNSDLTGEDPLVLPEIQQMLDDARGNLQATLDRLLRPMADGPCWFHQGEQLDIESPSDMRRELSRITLDVFSHTPRIHNELINRHKPSGTIVNSRKKLLMGILERHGTCDLGLKATTPDASMFRTILCNTGLYREEASGDYGYCSGKTSSLGDDLGLKSVWGVIREFFEIPSGEPKKPSELFETLMLPPYGIRRGLLPIFFGAGLKAFAKAVSLCRNQEYITDILPTVIEDVCRHPDEYELVVIELDEHIESYFGEIRSIFLGQQRVDSDTDAVRATYDAIQSWLFQLPKASLLAESLSPEAREFQRLLRDSRTSDPLIFLLQALPSSCGFNYRHNGQVRKVVEPLKDEIESVSHTYVRKACDSIYQALSRDQADRMPSIQKTAKQWASYFPESITSTRLPSIARGLLSRMKMAYEDEVIFVNSLALLLVGRSTEDWDDSTAIEFENKIQELTHRIETAVLSNSADVLDLSESQEIREGLAQFVTERIGHFYGQLADLVGSDKSIMILQKIMKGGDNDHT